MANISFARVTSPSGSVSFSQNPDAVSFGGAEEYLQPEAWSDGGVFYCYDKGNGPRNILDFKWSTLPSADFANLQTFFETMKQKRYSFTYTDINSITHTVRFYSKLSWNYNDTGETLQVSFSLLLV